MLGAILVLVFFLPIGLAMIVVVRCSRGGPIFAREETVGLHGKTFGRWRLYQPAERESVFDRVLWRAGLIDLPAAVNVIEGDMSLIGPRPHSPEQSAHLRKGRPDYPRRFEARPGMVWPTGSEDEPSWAAELDYVAQWSAFVDLKVAGRYAVRGLFLEEPNVD